MCRCTVDALVFKSPSNIQGKRERERKREKRKRDRASERERGQETEERR